MIFDLIVAAVFFFEVKSGFADGFIKSLLKTVGYISGAIGGLYLALQYDHKLWIFRGDGWLYRDWETDRKSTRLNSSHRL